MFCRRFAVYPEHLELIGQSNLLKVVGRIGGDMVAVEGRLRESGWAMIMPERPEEDVMPPPATFPEEMNNVALLNDMMRWIIGECYRDQYGI
jgi:CCR4-NOT transcriptional complex subunit CAF120